MWGVFVYGACKVYQASARSVRRPQLLLWVVAVKSFANKDLCSFSFFQKKDVQGETGRMWGRKLFRGGGQDGKTVLTRLKNWVLEMMGVGGRSRGFGYSSLSVASSQTSLESCSSVQTSLDSAEG